MRPEEENADATGDARDFYETQEGLSPLVIGYSWVVRVTTFCFEFSALLLLGRWIDARCGTGPWGLIVGATIGFYVLLASLVSVAKRAEAVERAEKTPRAEETRE